MKAFIRRPLVANWALVCGTSAVVSAVIWAFLQDGTWWVAASEAAAAAGLWAWSRRGPEAASRRAFAAAVKRHAASEFWLNRDEHLAFAVTRKRLGRFVVRVDEDSMAEIAQLHDEGAGSLPVAYEQFWITPAAVPVTWSVGGAVVSPGGIGKLPGGPRGLRRMWRDRIRRTTSGLGPRIAAPEEVGELIRQLAAAEPVRVPDAG